MKPIFAKRKTPAKPSIGEKVVAGLEAAHTKAFVKADTKSTDHEKPKSAPAPIKGKMSNAAKMPGEAKGKYCPTCGKKMSGDESESTHNAREEKAEKKVVKAKRAPTKKKE